MPDMSQRRVCSEGGVRGHKKPHRPTRLGSTYLLEQVWKVRIRHRGSHHGGGGRFPGTHVQLGRSGRKRTRNSQKGWCVSWSMKLRATSSNPPRLTPKRWKSGFVRDCRSFWKHWLSWKVIRGKGLDLIRIFREQRGFCGHGHAASSKQGRTRNGAVCLFAFLEKRTRPRTELCPQMSRDDASRPPFGRMMYARKIVVMRKTRMRAIPTGTTMGRSVQWFQGTCVTSLAKGGPNFLARHATTIGQM